MGLFGPPDIEKLKARRDVKGLIKALGYPDDYRVRAAAAWALAEIGDTLAIGPLIGALEDGNEFVRLWCIYALGRLKDTRAINPLIEKLGDKNEEVRLRTISVLGRMGAPVLVSLISAVGGEKPSARKAAVDALGKIAAQLEDATLRAREVEPVLIGSLGDNSIDVRQAAAKALDQIGWKPGKDKDAATYWIATQNWEECIKIGEPAVQPLIYALKDNVDSVRREAAKALGIIGDARSVEPILPVLEDSDADIRKIAAWTLGQIGDARAVEPLIVALKDQDWEVRRSAATALGKIGNEHAVEALIDLLEMMSGANDVAADALAKIGAPAVEPLIASLKNWKVSEVAAEMLGKIGDARAVEPLIDCLTDWTYPFDRKKPAKALIKLYSSKKLDPQTIQTILNQRDAIIKKHTDIDHTGKHVDGEQCGTGIHNDWHDDHPHDDNKGIGLDFPL